jgi:hypothetical protein
MKGELWERAARDVGGFANGGRWGSQAMNEVEDGATGVRADSLCEYAMRIASSLAIAGNVNGRFPGGAYSDDGID